MSSTLNEIGLRNRIDQASDKHNYLHRYETLFENRQIRRLGLVLGTRAGEIANSFAEFLPNTQITAVSYAPVAEVATLRPNVQMFTATNLIHLHRRLAVAAPFDVLIEDSPNRKSQKREIFRQFFPAVADGGLYIAEDLHASYIPSLLDDDKEDLWELVSRLLTIKSSNGNVPVNPSADDLNLSQIIDRVEFDGKLLAVGSKGSKLVKLRHGEATAILSSRYGDAWGRVVSKLGAQEITPNVLVTANNPDLARQKFPARLTVPELSVRHYSDVVAFPRQILLKDSMVLPDSFRLSLTGRLNNTALKPLNHYFAWPPLSAEEPRPLSGEYYYLDLEYNRHFGHFLTEAIPRLYAWDACKERNPTLKMLISSPTEDGGLLPYQADILRAYGVEDGDIHTFRSPVRVESLTSAMPLFHNGKYVHPMLRETFARLGGALRLGEVTTGERIFVSRRPGMWRECLNMTQLEALFLQYGFEVVYPEEMSLREQATMFSNAKVAAGYIGSALYGAMFNNAEMEIIGFVNTSYQSTNEYLIATALGQKMHVFWCDDVRGNRKVDNKGRPLAKTNYDYVFDFQRDGELLSRLLSSLG